MEMDGFDVDATSATPRFRGASNRPSRWDTPLNIDQGSYHEGQGVQSRLLLDSDQSFEVPYLGRGQSFDEEYDGDGEVNPRRCIVEALLRIESIS
jgi:hypothetical protein